MAIVGPMLNYQDYLKIFYDAEFTGLRRDTELISIGLVSETGSYFYAEFNDFDQTYIDQWLKENVIDNLIYSNFNENVEKVYPELTHAIVSPYSIQMKGDRKLVKEELLRWLQNESSLAEKRIQFFTDCYAYDWVLLNDLICKDGLALNLPEYINYIPIDLCAAMYMNGVDPDINREKYIEDLKDELLEVFPFPSEVKHNSLWDAYVIWYCFIKILNINKNCRIYEFDKFDDAFEEAVGRIKAGAYRGEQDHPKGDYNFEAGV